MKRQNPELRAPIQKICHQHRYRLRGHRCCVSKCRSLCVDFAHLCSAANPASGQTPHAIFGVSLCRFHHDEQHRLGAEAFGRKYGIDLWALAAEFARRSPDWEMRASLKLVSAAEFPGDRETTHREQEARGSLIVLRPAGADPSKLHTRPTCISARATAVSVLLDTYSVIQNDLE